MQNTPFDGEFVSFYFYSVCFFPPPNMPIVFMDKNLHFRIILPRPIIPINEAWLSWGAAFCGVLASFPKHFVVVIMAVHCLPLTCSSPYHTHRSYDISQLFQPFKSFYCGSDCASPDLFSFCSSSWWWMTKRFDMYNLECGQRQK